MASLVPLSKGSNHKYHMHWELAPLAAALKLKNNTVSDVIPEVRVQDTWWKAETTSWV